MYMIMIVLTQCCFSVTYMLLQCLLIFRISLYLYMLLQCLLIFRISLYLYIFNVSILCAFVILFQFHLNIYILFQWSKIIFNSTNFS